MNALITLHNTVFDRLERSLGDWFLPTLARFVFAAVLLDYYWHSAELKLGDGAFFGLFSPSLGAYLQIFPNAVEAAGFDLSNLSAYHTTVIVGATTAEFILPALILLGVLTRISALGMIGFVVVQSLTDIYAHGALDQPETLGAWFDRFSGSDIMDQRLFWVAILLILVIKGAGPISVDRLLHRKS